MSARLVSGFPEDFSVPAKVTAGTALQAGEILAINGNVLERATSSTTIHTIFGVLKESISDSATDILVIPFIQGQIWEVDTTNNTATDQLYESVALTDHVALSNTSSDVTGATGVFFPIAMVGAVTAKKMLGEFTRLQSTST